MTQLLGDNSNGAPLVVDVRGKRLRFLAVSLGVFGAIFALQGTFGWAYITINFPSMLAWLILERSSAALGRAGMTVVYFAQWSTIGYLISCVIYPKGKQRTT